MQEVYLDNSATTMVKPEVAKIIAKVLTHDYGNPSSLYRKGIVAESYLRSAREQISLLLGVSDKEIYFTSGGTEANNLAIKGTARYYRRRGRHLITTKIEHPSVLNCFQKLEKEGFEVSWLSVNRKGVMDLEELKKMLSPETVLISIMHINSEIGSIQPIREAVKIAKSYNPRIIFHVDGVQSFGKIPLKPDEWGVDLLSLSAHKLHGPKGSGALFVRRETLLESLLDGGEQEGTLRPGTENVPGIAGFGEAVALIAPRLEIEQEYLRHLKESFYIAVAKNINPVIINGPDYTDGSPHIINLLFPRIRGEVLLHALEEKGVFVSTGSACHSRRSKPSHVLQAIGRSDEEVTSSLRFSFSALNNDAQIKYTVEALKECINELQLFRRGGGRS